MLSIYFSLSGDLLTDRMHQKKISFRKSSSNLTQTQIFKTSLNSQLSAAGGTEALIVNPFEVVKVTLQSNRAK